MPVKKKNAAAKKTAAVMKEWKAGSLHSGKGGPVVKNQKQAIAIAMSEASKVKGNKMPAKKTTAKKTVAAKGKGFMGGKKVSEKKTGEAYASKGAMMKHEGSEGMKEMMKEYGPKMAAKKAAVKKPAVKKAVAKKPAAKKLKK